MEIQEVIKHLMSDYDYQENIKEILAIYFDQHPTALEEWVEHFSNAGEPVHEGWKKSDLIAEVKKLMKEQDLWHPNERQNGDFNGMPIKVLYKVYENLLEGNF